MPVITPSSRQPAYRNGSWTTAGDYIFRCQRSCVQEAERAASSRGNIQENIASLYFSFELLHCIATCVGTSSGQQRIGLTRISCCSSHICISGISIHNDFKLHIKLISVVAEGTLASTCLCYTLPSLFILTVVPAWPETTTKLVAFASVLRFVSGTIRDKFRMIDKAAGACSLLLLGITFMCAHFNQGGGAVYLTTIMWLNVLRRYTRRVKP
eukprot:6205868-Pleurochrysis_carterae.AAC.3